jgi:hypothetical protein
MDVKEVARQLTQGLNKDRDMDFIVKRLQEYMNEYNLSIKELNERCWEDSCSMFDYVYEVCK